MILYNPGFDKGFYKNIEIMKNLITDYMIKFREYVKIGFFIDTFGNCHIRV